MEIVASSLLTAMLISILAFLARNLFMERLRLELQKEHSKFLDELQWNRKVQEQAARVAEYLALARRLKESSPESDYERANQLAWELAMWLPDEIYKQMTLAIARPNQNINELSVAISVRKLLLGKKAGNLGPDDIAHHAPGIGKRHR
jgi:cell division protein FtsL